MKTAEITVRLRRQSLEFARRYAQAHQMTLDELIDRQLEGLQDSTSAEDSPRRLGGWDRLFQIGESIAAESEESSESMTLAVSSARR